MERSDQYFVVTSPGFEEICLAELAKLDISGTLTGRGGVEFSGGLTELYRANLWLRSASRILVRLDTVSARDFPTLFKRLVRLPWGRFIKPGAHCEMRVVCHRSRLNHSGRVGQTAVEAISKALGEPCSPDGETQRVFIRLEDDRCQVSIDSSGELLHRRGYRRAKVTAPLRENLAAGALLALGYDGSRPLVDGMTGSGTFAIEAALIATRQAPGLEREFAFMRWPKYRSGLWRQLCRTAREQQAGSPDAAITAVDNNPQAITAARQNAVAAGVAEMINFSCQPIQQLTANPLPGLLICNPPYGERIGRTAALRSLYRSLGQVYRETFSGWEAALVCPDAELSRAAGIAFKPLIRFSNGGIRVALLKRP